MVSLLDSCREHSDAGFELPNWCSMIHNFVYTSQESHCFSKIISDQLVTPLIIMISLINQLNICSPSYMY